MAQIIIIKLKKKIKKNEKCRTPRIELQYFGT